MNENSVPTTKRTAIAARSGALGTFESQRKPAPHTVRPATSTATRTTSRINAPYTLWESGERSSGGRRSTYGEAAPIRAGRRRIPRAVPVR